MAKKAVKPAATKRPAKKLPRPRGKSLAALNEWINANHDVLMNRARANCIKLTGKPTLGGTRRKKSA
jgi:hypothetical protein